MTISSLSMRAFFKGSRWLYNYRNKCIGCLPACTSALRGVAALAASVLLKRYIWSRARFRWLAEECSCFERASSQGRWHCKYRKISCFHSTCGHDACQYQPSPPHRSTAQHTCSRIRSCRRLWILRRRCAAGQQRIEPLSSRIFHKSFVSKPRSQARGV